MLYLTEDQARSWDVFKNKIPLNTFKFLTKEVKNYYKELLELEKRLRENSENIELQKMFDHTQNRLQKANKVLTDHYTIVVPPDQSEFCSMGTAVLVDIQGQKKWIIPDVCTTSPETVSFTNPLCKAILGKGRFDEGVFKNPNNDEEVPFIILDILPYSKTKKMFFAKKAIPTEAVA